ncbi:MAG: hypothetical protein NTU49_01080 [Gammaproteobacteria bacterium]|nr:hypothetical protein [Gammaproteobacteria bacterium]
MFIKKIFFFLFLFSAAINASDRIVNLPGLKKLPDKEYAGYVYAGKRDQLFYWFVASHKPGVPIIVWTNGGPGYSSMYGFFNENGPYKVTPSLTLKIRQHAWSRFANYLVIDQPAGIGLSHLKGNHLPLNREEGIDQYYHALYSFLREHPAYQNSPIILAGESYAGTYLPLLAEKILHENKKTSLKIHIQGLILMSPWVDPVLQVSQDSTYAFHHGLITYSQKIKIDALYQHCKTLIKSHQSKEADRACNAVGDRIQSISHVQLANIAYVKTTDNHLLDDYLRQKSALKAIHATRSALFSCWSDQVNQKYHNEIQMSVKPLYNQLLSYGFPILILSGLNDAKDTNYMGIQKLIDSLNWPSKNAYLHSKTTSIDSVGYLKSGGGLTWMKVLNAGHMTAQDQPNVDRIVKSFMKSSGRFRQNSLKSSDDSQLGAAVPS